MADNALHIHGAVRRGGQPVEGAYITLNQDGTFIAERRTGQDGTYEFNTTAGGWTLRCRASGADAVEQTVTSDGPDLAVDFDL
jgi:hypothetical protein